MARKLAKIMNFKDNTSTIWLNLRETIPTSPFKPVGFVTIIIFMVISPAWTQITLAEWPVVVSALSIAPVTREDTIAKYNDLLNTLRFADEINLSASTTCHYSKRTLLALQYSS